MTDPFWTNQAESARARREAQIAKHHEYIGPVESERFGWFLRDGWKYWRDSATGLECRDGDGVEAWKAGLERKAEAA